MAHEAQHSYWDRMFADPPASKEDWIVSPQLLSATMHKHVRPTDRILIVGCGVSGLAFSLFKELGCQKIVSTDISDVAIQQMAAKHADTPLIWKVADATSLAEFEDGSFDVIIDKGTSDTFFFRYKSHQRLEMAEKMFEACARVLTIGGRYIDITPRKKVPELDKYFPSFESVQLDGEANVVATRDGRMRPAFVHVCTKCLPDDAPERRGNANAYFLALKQEARVRLLAEGCEAVRRLEQKCQPEAKEPPADEKKQPANEEKQSVNEEKQQEECMTGVIVRITKRSSRMYVLDLNCGKVVADASRSADVEAFNTSLRYFHKGDRVCVLGHRLPGQDTLFSSSVFLLELSSLFENHATCVRMRVG